MNGDQKTALQNFLECFLRDECTLISKLPNLTKQKEHRRHGSISSPRSRPIISPQKISHLRITSSEHLRKPHMRHYLLSVTVCTKKPNTATSSANMMTARQKKQQSDIRSLSGQPITRSEKRPSRTHGAYQNYAKKECK